MSHSKMIKAKVVSFLNLYIRNALFKNSTIFAIG